MGGACERVSSVGSALQLLMVEGDHREKVVDIARTFGWEATGRTWPEEEIPPEVDTDARDWLVTWFVRGWTVLSSPDGNDANIDSDDGAEAISAELGTRVAMVQYESVSGLEVLAVFDAGQLVRAIRCYGGDPPTEEQGEPLCRSAAENPDFAEGSIFAALDALLGYSNDDLLCFEPKTSFAVRRAG